MKLNPTDRIETIEVLLTEERYPIAFANKMSELLEQKAFDSEQEARTWLKSTPIVLEIYYEKDAGLFAVESEVLDSCPETVCSPYTKEAFTEEDTPAECSEADEYLSRSLYGLLPERIFKLLSDNGIRTVKQLRAFLNNENRHIEGFGASSYRLMRTVTDRADILRDERHAYFPYSIPQDTHVTQLGLPERTANALWRSGVLSFGRLAAMSRQELLRIEGLGRNGIMQIDRLLCENQTLKQLTSPSENKTA